MKSKMPNPGGTWVLMTIVSALLLLIPNWAGAEPILRLVFTANGYGHVAPCPS